MSEKVLYLFLYIIENNVSIAIKRMKYIILIVIMRNKGKWEKILNRWSEYIPVFWK